MREDRRNDDRSNDREDRRDEYRSNGRDERENEDYSRNERRVKKDRRDHYLLQLPRIVGREQGSVIESVSGLR